MRHFFRLIAICGFLAPIAAQSEHSSIDSSAGTFMYTAPATPGSNGVSISGTPNTVKITVTKVEQKNVGCVWADITGVVTRCSNDTPTPNVRFGEGVAGKTFRITYTANADLSTGPTGAPEVYTSTSCNQQDDAGDGDPPHRKGDGDADRPAPARLSAGWREALRFSSQFDPARG